MLWAFFIIFLFVYSKYQNLKVANIIIYFSQIVTKSKNNKKNYTVIVSPSLGINNLSFSIPLLSAHSRSELRVTVQWSNASM